MRCPANDSEPSPRVFSVGRAASGSGSRFPSNVIDDTRLARYIAVFSRARILPPARPTSSFAPTASGCQCVLISVLTRVVPVAAYAARSSGSAFAARPPSTSSAPSSPRSARTLQPAPPSMNNPPPRSVVVICAAACCARNATPGNSTPPKIPALAPIKERRESKLLTAGCRIVPVDRRVLDGLTDGPDVGPHALRRAEHGPHRVLRHHDLGAELAQQRRLFLELRRLDRHERHEATRLRVVERREA